jgi:polar amino acid transport system substrate-binding protein
MKIGSFVAGIAGGLIVVLAAYFLHPTMHGAAPTKQTAFERVMQTKTLRCGYIIAEPGLAKDSATGRYSGPVYDLMSEIGKALDLKIDWAEETTFATAPEGLKTGRYDVICSTLYLRPNLMALVEFTQPFYYLPIYVVQRKGETRFKSVADIDRPEVTIAGVDGTMPSLLAAEDFKRAKMYSLPSTVAYSDNLLSVATNKADVVFVDPLFFYGFDKNNPGQLEINRTVPPLRIFANSFAVLKGEHDLATMLDFATEHLLNNGRVEDIIRKYEPVPGTFLRVSPPYVMPQK